MTRRHLSKPGRQGLGLPLGMLLASVLAAPAMSDEPNPPQIDTPPVIAGSPYVGSALTAGGAGWNRGTASWQWMRCDDADQRSCRSIGGANKLSYTVVPADLGKRLRVLLVVRDRGGTAWALSAATAVVTAAPAPDPQPSPDPSPSPQPSPGSSPSPPPPPVTQPVVPPAAAVEPPAPAGGALEQRAKALRMMDPAPVVRIRGYLTRSGARITLLTVRAPRGARIAVRCLGRGCPAGRVARLASLTRIARLEVALPAGTRLVISVTKPGRIGKHTTIVIRRGAAPTRRDRCLMPGARKPVRCPAA